LKRNLRLIFLIYGLSLVILIIISLLFAQRFKALIKASQQVEHTYKVRNQILLVQSDLIEAENSQRGFIVTRDSALLKPLRETQISILNEIETLKRLTGDNKNQQEILVSLKADVSSRYQKLYEALDDIKEGDENFEKFKETSLAGRKIMDDFKKLAAKMEQEELKLLREREQDKTKFEKTAPIYSTLIFIISCIFQVASFVFVMFEFHRTYLYQKQLEKNIQELNVSNAELEQIAFVASHDLQEPLRKIRTFSDMLLHKHSEQLNEEGRSVVERLIAAASRMRGLIEDLVNFNTITKTNEELKVVDLNKIVEETLLHLSPTINSTKAVIKKDNLPVIDGYEHQLKILFDNLIDNALKFSKPNESPIITISTKREKGSVIEPGNDSVAEKDFYGISVSDNGIGFEKNFAHKIFILFQRLHAQNSAYTGKGVGLAICKRVMINHNGYITATGNPNNGATFTVYFPIRSDFESN
jgi:signal transduction histidine kinase/biopolymer transport protein ExbD